MSGTPEGGKRAAAANKQRYGIDFYKAIGRKGGQNSVGGGFAENHERARQAGRKGGFASRRGPRRKSVLELAEEMGVSSPLERGDNAAA